MRRDKAVSMDGADVVGCKQNMVRPITTKVCRNNCSNYNYSEKKCNLGIKYEKLKFEVYGDEDNN